MITALGPAPLLRALERRQEREGDALLEGITGGLGRGVGGSGGNVGFGGGGNVDA